MEQARAAIDLILGRHPYPAVAVDRRWDVVNANEAAFAFLEGIDPEALSPRLNVYKVTLHPRGLRPRIVNFEETSDDMIARLQQQVAGSADPQLIELLEEMRGYLGERPPSVHVPTAQVLLPMRLRLGDEVVSLMSTISVFGTPVDITLAELALELFFPADAASASILDRRS